MKRLLLKLYIVYSIKKWEIEYVIKEKLKKRGM